uniref:Murine leukemia virus integrase C-terminal domain-containing protein n=1 Tax=Chrysemys picta bellii TaxID=8478 RepID=A0A8C3IJL2_CHRPI
MSLHRYAAQFQSLPADVPAHWIKPGSWVYAKEWRNEPLQPRWAGPFQVLLTSHTAIRVREWDTWIHHTRVKLAPRPGPEADDTGLRGSPASSSHHDLEEPEQRTCRLNRNFCLSVEIHRQIKWI